jgi:TDG/mug DNA glycosylase family protein
VNQSLPDLIDYNLRALFCGINPGAKAAQTGHHFEGRNNRFWKTMHASDLTPVLIEPKNDSKILDFGIGLTTVVSRPTKRADELTKEDFLLSADQFKSKILKYRPQRLIFLGKAGYSRLIGNSAFDWGKQDQKFLQAQVWILPNPQRTKPFIFFKRLSP